MSRKLDILIVDDDVDNALSLGELMEIEGHRARVVHSGEAAIEAYVRGNFDVSFVDVMMPGLNGVESFLKIRKLRPAAKIFMMTGFSVSELLQQALCNGAMGVLDKPMDPQSVIDLVRDVGENGVVVVPRFAQGFGNTLAEKMAAAGMPCQMVGKSEAAHADKLRGIPVIMDFNASLIDTVEHYSALRSVGPVPATVIVAGSEPVQPTGTSVLGDMAVTGILTKPFDPEELLKRLSRHSDSLS